MIELRLVWSPTEPSDAPGTGLDHHLRLDAEQLAEVRRPLLHAHRFVAAPVHDRRRHGRRCEERLELGVDVVVVDRAVGDRVPAGHDRLPAATAWRCQSGSPPRSP